MLICWIRLIGILKLNILLHLEHNLTRSFCHLSVYSSHSQMITKLEMAVNVVNN